ncbi:MAG TPA: T9SS type A sorting domain-containing protein [Ferruginibacter sp.]|mgnify:CR=1 FL=1|nr:T9SS type A sorting domain-containing protein [Ferruginibacter sp.]
MRTMHPIYRYLGRQVLVNILLLTGTISFSQTSPAGFAAAIGNYKKEACNTAAFIENIGQYGKEMRGFENMGPIQYGYEGSDMLVLFTPRGVICFQRKTEKLPRREERKLERQGLPEEEIERRRKITERVITMEWGGANTTSRVVEEDKTTAYHTYGMLKDKAYGYKKITYKNVYPGIDVVYSFAADARPGFEYSLLVKPGADLNTVRLVYGGDVNKIKQDDQGRLIIRSDIDGISTSLPVSYYGSKVLNRSSGEVRTAYKINGKEIRFSFPSGYDSSRDLVIDPFVSSTGSLTGLNAGKAKDVDFDYAGNIYVTGGGSYTTTHSLAKYDAAGVLQWTFNGTLAIPSWTFGTYYGGWMVEKPTGNIYLGQGFNPATGFRVIRVNTNGLYDNYITTANPNFMEAWKMFWSCNNGSPQIIIAGGGINSNINFGVFTPPSTTVTSLNITGVPYTGANGWAQDIADFVFDPANNDMYSIFGSLIGTPSIGNKIYKNTAPYSAASVAWNVPSGYNTVNEAANRPYLVASGLVDNSANMLWVNASYLYYWDGKNLKAFNKATGAGVGTPITTANTAFMQGGIIADACNNIFVGEANGLVKVYHFDGNTFSDAPTDISIPGYSGKSVYDLAYDESRKLLYASGDGFVASFDVSAYCPSTLYTVNITTDCIAKTASATVSPVPPPGSVVTYTLYNGAIQVAVNSTGNFTGLSLNITYSIVATVNQACSGSQASAAFNITGPGIGTSQVNTTCGASTGSITLSGSGGVSPYTYSIDGINFQPSGIFTGLPAGIYVVTVKDQNGCQGSDTLIILNTNGPALSFTQTNATCGNNAGTVTANATGGVSPYQYSINGGSTYQSGNFFTGLVAGQYTLLVKDANNCTNSSIVTITSSTAPSLSVVPFTATCNQSNGTITAFATGGTVPYQYSINGNTFQAGNIFSSLSAGTYTVTVKDANGCTKTATAVIGNAPAPTVTATSSPAACGNINGTVTATGNGGIPPYQFSIDGGATYQAVNVFFGLAPGVYTITIKDNTGCTNTVAATVNSTNAPTVTAAATASSCAANTGSITAAGSGGVIPYQYSINGITYQASNIFNSIGGGNYIVYIRDNAGCIGTVTIVVPAASGPLLTATTTPSSCSNNDGTITATGTGGTAPLQYSIDGTNYQAGNVFTGLAPGTYTVYVKDANNCLKTTIVIVANVSGLALSVSTVSSSCSANSGTITATATGGIAPLQYSIDGTNYQVSNVFTGLAPGTYTVYVKDANGCIVTKQANVTFVAGLSLTATVLHQATCGSSNGVIRATGSGGTAPLTYNIDGGAYQAINFFINVATGVHTLTAKDANGCISAPQSVTITNSGAGTIPTDVTFTIKDAFACTGQTGRIKNLKGVPSGGGNSYTFSLDGGAFTTSNQFTNVSVGVHTVTAMHEDGCTITKLATIGSGVPASATATATAAACNTTAGSITISGVGGSTPYHASVDNGTNWVTFFPPGANTLTFTGLAPGSYTVIMADDADFTAGPPDIPGACLTTINVVVPSLGGPGISTSLQPATCNSNNGSITATGSGGVAPYSYNINGGAYFASGVFNNLVPGIYAVGIKDANNCMGGATVTLPGGAVPSVTAAVLPAACNTNNGTITVNASGGTAPFEYSLNGTVFQPSNIFTGLTPGSYTVYAKDAGNCYGSASVIISNVPRVQVTAFTVAASCGNSDGMIVATGSAGTAPYLYSLNGTVFQSGNIFTNLAAGFYTVTIKDARDCINTTGIAVSNSTAPIIAAAATPATCGNANGSITVTSSGGAAPLQYSIDGINFQASNIFNGLITGNYIAMVKDANGCINAKQVFVGTVNGPQVLTAAIIHAVCGLNNGTITATAAGGTGALQYSINGTTYQAGTVFNGVGAGSYTLYVKDANSCIKTLPVLVNNLAGPAAVVSSSPASCGLSDGTITVTATGGTLALTYSNNGGTSFQASNIFTGLTAGTYNIVVKDARGCIYNTSVDVTAINFVGNLAGVTGGIQVCNSGVVSAGGTVYVDQFCNLIAKVVPSGAAPVTGMINSCVIIDGSVQVFNVEPYVQRHFDIEPVTNPNNATATITLYFKDQEFVDFNTNRSGFPALPTLAGGGNSDPARANLKVTQYHGVPVFPHNSGNPSPGFYSVNGGAGVLIVPTSVNYNSGFGYWEVTFPITGFSGFYVHTNIHFPLPIKLEYFRGHRLQGKHVLNWKVNCNTNPGATLDLERSADARNFSGIYSVVTDAARCLHPFDHTDSMPLPGINYYRLKMKAADGRVSYSNVLSFVNGTGDLEIIRISPNPVTDGRFVLELSSTKASAIDIAVIDMQGRTLHRRAGFVTAGMNRIPVNADNLASGSYAVSVKTASAVSVTLRFVKE